MKIKRHMNIKKVLLCLSKKNMLIDSVCARSLNKAVRVNFDHMVSMDPEYSS